MTLVLKHAEERLAAGDYTEATRLFAELVKLVPQRAEGWHGLGRVAMQLGRTEQAFQMLTDALHRAPTNADYYVDLGRVLILQERRAAAVAALEAALKQNPQHTVALLTLIDVFLAESCADQAETYLTQAEATSAPVSKLLLARGRIERMRGNTAASVEHFERALQLDADDGDCWFYLGSAFTELGRHTEATEALETAIQLKPTLHEACFNLGNARRSLHQTGASIAAYERALKIKPTFIPALINLSNAIKDQGRIDESLDLLFQVEKLEPLHRDAASNIAQGVQYSPRYRAADILKIHQKWHQNFAAEFWKPSKTFSNDRSPDRPLKIGFSTNAFGFHPVGMFAIAGFEALDPKQFIKVVYSTRGGDDSRTHRFQAAAAEWVDCCTLNDAALAERIENDRIDILIDLAGHLSGNRALVMARKPAPVTVNWVGYTGTMGLKAIDYIIADKHHIPESSSRFYVEQVVRLPDGHICFEPPSEAPDVGPLPCLSSGFVTFSSFNNPAKVHAGTIDLWSQILKAVPGSRLWLKYRNFDDSSTKQYFESQFAARGVAPDRLRFEGVTPFAEMLGAYNSVDLALDTFPFTGGMTSCAALWMGCPVVTWPQDTFASRQTLSYLNTIGITDTIATSAEDYVVRAVALATNPSRLAELRSNLRSTMAASPFCDREKFGQNLGQALRGMWHRWVEHG